MTGESNWLRYGYFGGHGRSSQKDGQIMFGQKCRSPDLKDFEVGLPVSVGQPSRVPILVKSMREY